MTHDDEARLWRAVILQAFADAAAPADNRSALSPRSHAQRIAARAWLTRPSRDLFDVCRLADQDCNQVMDVARKLKAKGWPDVTEGHHRTHILERHPQHAAMEIDPPQNEEVSRSAGA
jgi:hypothetical protein